MHAPLAPALQIEMRDLGALAIAAAECRELTARALEPNVFYDAGFMLAAAPVFGHGVGVALLRSPAGRLMGLFPARRAGGMGGLRAGLVGWTHPFAPLGTPIIDRNEPEAVIAAWLDGLAASAGAPATLMLPLIPENGAFATALTAVLARTGRRYARLGRHARALLAPDGARDGYVEHAVSTGRRKELRRQRRRLEEIAPVRFDTATDPAGVLEGLKDFLVLEASGWKGMAGTAAAGDPAIRRFVETAVAALASEGRVRVDRLRLNGQAIAATVTLMSGGTAWCWKIAYNEGVAAYSPGVQLMLELTPGLLADPAIARADSCAVADHPMIDRVWRERLAICDWLIELRPSAAFPLACGIETARRSAVTAAKALRDRARGRRSGPRPQQASDDFASRGHRHLVDEGDLARVFMRR
ncbi:MAG: GNAT family N-acetyltransferase [Alphaproteobacteria bacterium]|nr:GNAT family N-acetyltransferase [Alphaproteobacteria bacterium]